MVRYIVWKDVERTVGMIVNDSQLAYELRKGALNTLGMIEPDLMEAWAEATAYDNCFIEKVEIEPTA